MKNYICILASVALLTACEQKETSVANPPAENKTETNTTIVKESPAPATTTETNTTINTGTPASSPNP